MFHDIPEKVKERMEHLEQLNARHRRENAGHWERLRQVPPETGRFLALLASRAPDGINIEIGTSGGYSGLWISLALRMRGQKLITFEIQEGKAQLARETFDHAGVSDMIEIVQGDAREFLPEYDHIAFCFLDAEKEVYQSCYDTVIPRMITGGIFVADNITSHKQILSSFTQNAFTDTRVDALAIPIGSGVLVCTRI
jgi:predicted O-methyltransferase YrrM